ncbi:hypothetical protein HQQ81_02925 [Microbacteriaceae bacterium VKM Ac-2854]|nr:hypothetical protein [Microbacteriaceae bacterium VKM Ac-2854]
MRSIAPDPRNPWPHDMVLSIDQPRVPLVLLYARALRGLAIPEVPGLESGPEPSEVELDDTTADRWRRDWARWWSRHLPRTTEGPDPETARLLRELSDGELVEHVAAEPRGWLTPSEEAAFAAWRDPFRERHDVPLDRTPERVCLDALIPAWRNGLTTILELPYAGDVADRISAECLVVSRRTRLQPELYARALAQHPSA